jgi:hypothetical protein
VAYSAVPMPDGDTDRATQPGSAVPTWRSLIDALIAGEVSTLTRYADRVVSFSRRPRSLHSLSQRFEGRISKDVSSVAEVCEEVQGSSDCVAVVLDGIFNHHHDIDGLLRTIGQGMSRTSRVVSVMYNPYLRWLYQLANRFGLREGALPSTFVTTVDLANISKLAGFEVVRERAVAFIPWRWGGVGIYLNRVLASLPLIRYLSLAWVVTLRPIKKVERPSLSVVIPARNERGNIEAALSRFPDLGIRPEIVFVEGHSDDGTWEEIERVSKLYADRFAITCLKQEGIGKVDAVRLGLSHASGDVLTILDADLTMPPELLGRFYDAWCNGLADFINGNRLVYSMEGNAMRFLNKLGNVFFAKALSFVIGARIGDSLCGTKLFSKSDYGRMVRWREDFGDFDPFGDFELIYPAAALGLGIVDVPIRYRDRVYGQTKIRRFRDGFKLLQMTILGFLSLRVGAKPTS